MAAPLSLHHIRPHFFPAGHQLFHKPTAITVTTTPLTAATKTNQAQQHPCLTLLDNCSSMSELKQIHAQLLRNGLFFDAFTISKMVAFSAIEDSGDLNYSRLVLSQIHNPNGFTCNAIIRGYTNKDMAREAILFYREMIAKGWTPDRFTFPSLFKSCKDLSEGKQLHCQSTKLGFGSDSYIQNTLMNMYSTCGCLVSARKVFDKMSDKGVVSWATMIYAYARWDQSAEALRLFEKMERENVELNEVALLNVLTACGMARDLETAKRVHRCIEEYGFGSHLKLSTALMDVYCKCGCVSLARELFAKMPEKNLFCWNILINGHVEESDYDEAFQLFRRMQLEGEKGDKVTMVSLLLACSNLGALELGKWLHAYIEKQKIEADVALGTTLVDMYAKCGSIEIALDVFRTLPERDLMTWTALISGFAMCGKGKEALELFHEMQMSGVKPDAVTFVGVLAACSHAGLVDEGLSHFNSMSEVYGILPTIEHYGCMVDVLGRAGRIAEAEELIQKMRMKPDRFVLGGLLGACRVHGNLEAAERAAKQLLELNPDDEGTYVLLSNLYSSMQKWEEAIKIRKLMADRNIKKPPGCSLIEVEGIVHEFVKGDSSHPQSTNIYAMLDDMISRLKKAGYAPQKSEVLFDMDEEEKETALSLHSEKLAIAFGLISTNPGTTIRVVKNLRVCSDCHTATKLISKVYNREIIVRDRNRFHQFKDGTCSCKDFW